MWDMTHGVTWYSKEIAKQSSERTWSKCDARGLSLGSLFLFLVPPPSFAFLVPPFPLSFIVPPVPFLVAPLQLKLVIVPGHADLLLAVTSVTSSSSSSLVLVSDTSLQEERDGWIFLLLLPTLLLETLLRDPLVGTNKGF